MWAQDAMRGLWSRLDFPAGDILNPSTHKSGDRKRISVSIQFPEYSSKFESTLRCSLSHQWLVLKPGSRVIVWSHHMSSWI